MISEMVKIALYLLCLFFALFYNLGFLVSILAGVVIFSKEIALYWSYRKEMMTLARVYMSPGKKTPLISTVGSSLIKINHHEGSIILPRSVGRVAKRSNVKVYIIVEGAYTEITHDFRVPYLFTPAQMGSKVHVEYETDIYTVDDDVVVEHFLVSKSI